MAGPLKFLLPQRLRGHSRQIFALKAWRDSFNDVLAYVMLVGLPIVCLTTFPILWRKELHSLIALIVSIWVFLAVHTFWVRRNYKHRRLVWVSVTYILTISFFIALGPSHARPTWLLFCVILPTLFFGVRGAVLATAFNVLWLGALYLLMDPASAAWADTFAQGRANWVMFMLSSSLLCLGAGIPVGLLISHLDSALRQEQAVREKLSEEGQQLSQANERLRSEMAERKEVVRALQRSEERYRLVVDNAMEAIVISQEGVVQFVNKRAEDISGLSRKRFQGTSMLELIHPDDREMVYQRYQARMSGQDVPSQYRFRIKTVQGRTVWFDNYAVLVEWDGNPATLSFLTDITALVESEQESRQYERQLRQAQKMEAIGTLAGGIAHDFNNILTAIMGYAELLQMKLKGNGKEPQYVEHILAAGKRARDLIHQILTFSRQTEKQAKPVRLKVLVNEALKLIRASLPSTVEIKSVLNSDALVMGDASQLHQVIMNLCTNAGAAMAGGEGTLEVLLSEVEVDSALTSQYQDIKPGRYLKLEVKDNGCGMAQEVLARIYEPFFTTRARGEGTGLGLAVTHGIVKAHQGLIYAYSEPGHGSSFQVFLPLIEPMAQEETASEDTSYQGHGTVLVVDDEPVIVELAQEMLQALGFEVVTAKDGQQALEILDQDGAEFDLVITDLTMPHITGDKLARQIGQAHPGLPVILSTGFRSKISQQRMDEMGIKALIQKPMLTGQLVRAIRQALGD